MRTINVRHVCAVVLKGPLMGQPTAYDSCELTRTTCVQHLAAVVTTYSIRSHCVRNTSHVAPIFLRISYVCCTYVVWPLENHMAGTHNLVAYDMRKQCVSNAYDMLCRHMSRLRRFNRLRVQKKSPSPGALWTTGASSWTTI